MRVRSIQRRTALRAGVALAAVAIALLLPSTALAAAPTATTNPPSNITATSAVFGAGLSPNGAATTWHFEYATQAEFDLGSYPHATPDKVLGFNAGVAVVPYPVGDYIVSLRVDGLTPDTTYHVRVVASNSDGTSVGEDRSFTTLTG